MLTVPAKLSQPQIVAIVSKYGSYSLVQLMALKDII